MNWSDERYVRLYTRDSSDWLCMSFLAQGLLCLVMRKVDRAGVLPLGRSGRKSVAIAIGHAHQWPMLEPALEELLEDGCVKIEGDLLVIPNFIEAQEALASDAARAKKHREVRRDLAKLGVKNTSHPVTDRHEPNEPCDGTVTPRDAGVTGRVMTVTPSLAVPNRTEPTSQPMHAGRARVKIGPLGSELRLLVEQGLGHGLIPCSQPEADELEGLIESFGGVDPAKDFVASTVRKRSTDPQSMAWIVTVLRPSVATEARS
jgi:hypothetical protein